MESMDKSLDTGYTTKVPEEQDRVPEDQKDVQLHQEPDEYQLNVHRAVSSPSIANLAIKTAGKTATSSLVAETMERNVHVDDSLKSVPSTNTVLCLINDHRHTCSTNGFRLTKFISNGYDVMMSMPPKEDSKEMAKQNIVHGGLPAERALGLQWGVERDCFQFVIKNKLKPATRRRILSVTSSLYDPLGFVAPVVHVVMPVKRVMQDLCKERHLDWDEEVPNEILVKWHKWISELLGLEEISMTRCVKPSGSRTASNDLEVHTARDASSSDYGSVVYLRLRNTEGRHHVSFYNGKSRVPPLKSTTTLHLGLTVDGKSIRLAKMTHAIHRFPASVADHEALPLKKPSRSRRLTADEIEYPESNVKWLYSTALLPEETRLRSTDTDINERGSRGRVPCG